MDWYTYFSELEQTSTPKKSQTESSPQKRTSGKRLGELLTDWGLIDSVQLNKALDIQKNLIKKCGQTSLTLTGEILLELGIVQDEDIVKAIATQCRLPYFPVSHYRINPEALDIIPEETARKHTVIPLDKFGKCLTVATTNPFNRQAMEDIRKLTGCCVQYVLCHASGIKKAIEQSYRKALV